MDSKKQFANKYGYLTEDGYEFVVTDPQTPRPWANIISNGDFSLAVSQAGGGFSWRTHVSLNRLTRWNQDMIRDDQGKWLYLRDLDNGKLRSLAFQPMQADYDLYEARHGLGYSTFIQEFEGMRSEWTMFAAKDDPVELWIVTLKNKGTQKRNFQLSSYFEWNLGAAPDNHREFHKLFIDTEFDAQLNTLSASKFLWEVPTDRGHWNTVWPYIGFHSVSEAVSGWDTSKDDLIGRHGGFHDPKGLGTGKFSQKSGRFQDAAASLAVDITLNSGEEKTLVFLLGQIDRQKGRPCIEQVQPYVEKFGSVSAAREELIKIKNFWKELTGRMQVKTPDPAFNALVNIWLKYQTLSAHMWARSGYFQQSGAYGFRDQLQSSQIWLAHDPVKMLEHIKLNARHQFRDGTVLHWWHPLTDKGLQTKMTDDLLWLPYMTARYLREAEDLSALDEIVPYYDEGSGNLLEHCLLAVDKALQRISKRDIPLIGEGDWCDGFSAVGLEWKGESIWLGMFLYRILMDWIPLLEKDSKDKASAYAEWAERLKKAVNSHGWNEQWYIAATKDDGTPIGDPSQEECKMYLNSQTWAIISGIADAGRQEQVADAMLGYLEGNNGFMLFHPAFHKPDRYIGYITRYAPGLRENGGVYTHAATWGVWAMAALGRADDALRNFNELNPFLQSMANADRYQAEPFVLPGNVDGKDSEYYGRAGWAWYTGSAGWLFTIALENILGIQPTREGIKIDPCISENWPEVQVRRKFRGAIYHIRINNSAKKNGGVNELTINGQKIMGNVIPVQAPGEYNVLVSLKDKT